MSSHAKISISLPLDLVIRLDIIREENNYSRSRWIKETIEEKLTTKSVNKEKN